MELEKGAENEVKEGSVDKEDPYNVYMRSMAGNMTGQRSENIKKMNKLKRMEEQNLEVNEHQVEVVPQEEGEKEKRGHIEDKDEEEKRFIHKLVEEARQESNKTDRAKKQEKMKQNEADEQEEKEKELESEH